MNRAASLSLQSVAVCDPQVYYYIIMVTHWYDIMLLCVYIQRGRKNFFIAASICHREINNIFTSGRFKLGIFFRFPGTTSYSSVPVACIPLEIFAVQQVPTTDT